MASRLARLARILSLTGLCQLALLTVVLAGDGSARAAGYSTWHSHNPGICLDQVFDKYYLTAITEAWIVRGDEQEGQRLLQEYADLQRCEDDLGLVAATFVYGSEDRPETALTISAASDKSRQQQRAGHQDEEIFDLELREAPQLETFIEDWNDSSEIRDRGGEIARNRFGPFYVCIANVMVWQEVTQWTIGQWNARHRGTCYGSVFGRLLFDLKGDHVEAASGEDVYRSTHRIQAPHGGSWDVTRQFSAKDRSFVFRWSPRSTYVLQVGGLSLTRLAQSLSDRPVNVKGREYPKISAGGRAEVWFPDAPPTFKGRRIRIPSAAWDALCRAEYRRKGWDYPENLMPVSFENNHVRPLRWNGRNNMTNCYRLEANHHYFYTVWWAPNSNFRTPISN